VPADSKKLQSDSSFGERAPKAFAILKDSIGRFIPPAENRDPSFRHGKKGPRIAQWSIRSKESGNSATSLRG
jgi:hypothetical protein